MYVDEADVWRLQLTQQHMSFLRLDTLWRKDGMISIERALRLAETVCFVREQGTDLWR